MNSQDSCLFTVLQPLTHIGAAHTTGWYLLFSAMSSERFWNFLVATALQQCPEVLNSTCNWTPNLTKLAITTSQLCLQAALCSLQCIKGPAFPCSPLSPFPMTGFLASFPHGFLTIPGPPPQAAEAWSELALLSQAGQHLCSLLRYAVRWQPAMLFTVINRQFGEVTWNC